MRSSKKHLREIIRNNLCEIFSRFGENNNGRIGVGGGDAPIMWGDEMIGVRYKKVDYS